MPSIKNLKLIKVKPSYAKITCFSAPTDFSKFFEENVYWHGCKLNIINFCFRAFTTTEHYRFMPSSIIASLWKICSIVLCSRIAEMAALLWVSMHHRRLYVLWSVLLCHLVSPQFVPSIRSRGTSLPFSATLAPWRVTTTKHGLLAHVKI